MSKSNFDRRKFLGVAIGSAIAGPAIMNASRVNAAEIQKMAGKLIIPGLPGSEISDGSTKALASHISNGRAGGALFLRHNITTGDSIKALACAFNDADQYSLLAIDQEGGKVQRLGKKQGFTPIPTARWVAGNKSIEEAEALYKVAGAELRAAGFNLNMAPSVDIHDPKNPVIGKYNRGFSTDVERISAYASAFVRGFASAGVACSIKHFPGHGSSRSDSHDGFVDISETWTDNELVPFKKLADTAPLVMSSHLFHSKLSNGKAPVTFSQKAITRKLRRELGYQGVILSDDLDMGAIRKNFELEEAVLLALEAGNDLLLLSNSLKYDEAMPADVISWITRAVRDGRLSSDLIEASYARVMQVRKRFKA